MNPTVPTALSIANDEASADLNEFDQLIIPDFDYVWLRTSDSAHSLASTIPEISGFNPSPGVPILRSLLDLLGIGRGDSISDVLFPPNSDNPADDVPSATDFPIDVSSVPSALFPTNNDQENKDFSMHFPLDDNPVPGSAISPSATREPARRAKNPKRLSEADRIETLHSDEWVADFDATWVLCGICANKIKLDDRGSARYYPQKLVVLWTNFLLIYKLHDCSIA